MVEKTVFSKKEIVKFLKDNYNISVKDIIKINNGSANIYKIVSENRRYILKEFQSKYHNDIILREINVINFLRNKDFLVPKYVYGIHGEIYFEYKGRTVIVQEYIDGYTKKNNTGNISEILESAKYLALIVNNLEEYPYKDLKKYGINNYNSYESLASAREKNNSLINLANKNKTRGIFVIKDLIERDKILENIIEKGIYKEINNISLKNSHGDYSVSQFIYKNNKIKAIIDFVNAANLPISYEIMRSYAYIDKECKNGVMNIDNLILYIKEFMKYSKLNVDDIKYMPYIYLITILKSCFGYEEFLSTGNFLLLKKGKNRTKIARYLYNNISMISIKLVNSIQCD